MALLLWLAGGAECAGLLATGWFLWRGRAAGAWLITYTWEGELGNASSHPRGPAGRNPRDS